MNKKEIQEELEKLGSPHLKMHYIEEILKKPNSLKKDIKIAAIDILAELNSQTKDYYNSAFLYKKIGKNKEEKEQLINASKLVSSNDSPLKSYEKAAIKLEERGYKEEAKEAWKNAFLATESELKYWKKATGIVRKEFDNSPYKKAISLAKKAGMYDKAKEIEENYTEKESQEERHQRQRTPLLERILAKVLPAILIMASIIIITLSGSKTTGYFILDQTGTLNYPLLIALIIFILAIAVIIKNKRKSKQ